MQPARWNIMCLRDGANGHRRASGRQATERNQLSQPIPLPSPSNRCGCHTAGTSQPPGTPPGTSRSSSKAACDSIRRLKALEPELVHLSHCDAYQPSTLRRRTLGTATPKSPVGDAREPTLDNPVRSIQHTPHRGPISAPGNIVSRPGVRTLSGDPGRDEIGDRLGERHLEERAE